MYANALLDRARQKWKSDAKIAEAIGITRQALHRMSTGQAKMPPERAALLAAALGEDADYAAKRVMVDNAEGDLHARLAKAFRVAAGVAGVAVLVALGSVPSPANAGAIKTDRELPLTLRDLSLSSLSLVLDPPAPAHPNAAPHVSADAVHRRRTPSRRLEDPPPRGTRLATQARRPSTRTSP